MRIGKYIDRLGALKWRILVVYLLLLAVSYLVRWNSGETIAPDVSVISLPAIDNDRAGHHTIRLAYKEYKPQDHADSSAVVLLHSNQDSVDDLRKLATLLGQRYRVIVTDLHSIPDYSIRAHARYVLAMMDQLRIEQAHIVGASIGGGVALNITDIAPARVRSLTMLTMLGLPETELLGNYHLNHAINGIRLAFLWILHHVSPHFGWRDYSKLSLSYARNLYATDQRPLRAMLGRYDGPMLIIQGQQNLMARADYRLAPQSEVTLFADENQLDISAAAINFFERVDRGLGANRASADVKRIALSTAPFNPAVSLPKGIGSSAVVLFVLLALATLITEDLTCIWAGVLAAEGRISFVLAAFACLVGIFVGDILLFLAGRLIGRTILRRAPLKWFVRESDVERCSRWFEQRGMGAIVLSRFLPGTRLPTYFAAGLLDTSFLKFTFYFFVAAAVWTPMLVGTSMLFGRGVIESALISQNLMLRLTVTALLVFILVRLAVQLMTFRGRRFLRARWLRIRHWEFWPPWAFYPPVILYVIWLGLKHRSLTLFTCANPSIEEGGFIGESKNGILAGLGQSIEARRFIASWALIEKSFSKNERMSRARQFMRERSLNFPVVLKPDAGERGSGVAIVKSDAELDDYLQESNRDVIIQEYAAGQEIGLFYYRYPNSERGRILSITKKVFPVVVGDGLSTLEKLILRDDRAACMARVYFDAQRQRLWDVPARGEIVQLIEIGTHCRGSVFLDGIEIRTTTMEEAIDRLAKGFKGFYFGRFDIRTPSLTDFQQGLNFKIVELNGVTSEATSIYDRKNSLLAAYRVLFNQWRIAFEVGAQNRARGVQPASTLKLARLVFENWRRTDERFRAEPRPIGAKAKSATQLATEV